MLLPKMKSLNTPGAAKAMTAQMTTKTTTRAGIVTIHGLARSARKANENTRATTAMRRGPEKTASQSPAGM